jgi:uncharacterized protein (UPF0332 family)
MSPRSAEFYDAARRRLATARGALDTDPATALSVAYYAMLYAARAALSERDTYARTHSGVWNLFHQTFVETGDFDDALTRGAQKVQREREDADYEAWDTPEEEARRVIELADRFSAAVHAVLEESDGFGKAFE